MLNSSSSSGAHPDGGGQRILHVLVLCTGNICRSPVAASMLQARLGHLDSVQILAAGLNAPDGVKPHALAVKTAAYRGYTVEGPGSTQVTLGMVEQANLVLVMDLEHRRLVLTRFPSAAGKTFLLGEWSGGEILDPMGKSESYFNETAEKLDAGSEQWAKRIEALRHDI